jgi:hypothetical protein
MVVLAGLLLLIQRAGQPLWVPAICTGLAVLAISTRMFFQPVIFSYLFLALTLFILTLRSTQTAVTRKNGAEASFLANFAAWPYRLYTLPVLFAVWANVDAWFILGPVTVALYLLGEALQEAVNPVPRGPDAPERGESRRLAWVLGLGVAACLLNPHHVHVFAIPTEISPTLAADIKNDDALKRMFWSPWEGRYVSGSGVGHSLADMVYYPLLVLSFASFIFNRASWRWWRGLTWAAFAALSAYHARSIPFFAVVAAPIMTLNFQDALLLRRLKKHAAPVQPSAWPFAGRVLSALSLAVVVAAAWPGWLHGLPDEAIADSRHVGWSLDVDPAMVETAQQLARWRQEGMITGEQNAFNLHPDTANYLAFYCPEEKTFFDYRFLLFKDTAATYYQIRNDLDPQRAGETAKTDAAAHGSKADWRKVFRDQHVRHLLVYDPDQRRTFPVIRRIYEETSQRDQREWTLIDQHGRIAVFAWSDPEKGRDDALQAMEVNPNRRAFGPNAARSPGQSAGHGPASADEDWLKDFKDWWEKYATRPPSRTPDSYEARFHNYGRFLEAQRAQSELSTKHAEQVAAAIGFGAGPTATLPGECLYRLTHWGQAITGPAERFSGSASTLLAIRAARRALAANPSDDAAYFWLGVAYQQLPEATSPMELKNPQSLLAEIRRCQIAGCLYNAAKLNPDWLEVHQHLARLYLLQGFDDIGLPHLKEELRLTEKAGPNPGEENEAYRQRLSRMRDNVKALDDKVKNNENDFLIATKDWTKVLPKAQMAFKRGLAGKTIDLLIKTSPVELGPDGLLMELRLLLAVGRVEDVRANWSQDLTDDPQIGSAGSYGLPIYKWLLILQAAAVGDYDKADETLAQMMASVEKNHLEPMPRGLTPLIGLELNAKFLDPVGLQPLPWQAFQRYELFMNLQQMKRFSLVPPAVPELSALRGLLALEKGDTVRAAQHFRTGLDLSWPPRRYLSYLSILGTSTPLEAITSTAGDAEATQGLMVPLPSRWLAVEYLRLMDQAAK